MVANRPSAPPQTPLQLSQHQLRNKLGIVMGTIDIVRQTETLSKDGDEDIARIKRACQDMLALIDGLPIA